MPSVVILVQSDRVKLVQRRVVQFSGHVQGVGFRYTTRRVADGYRVTGYVKNLPDGRVELVVEGESKVIAGFLAELTDKMGYFIRDTRTDVRTATGEFQDFVIRF